MSFFGIRFGGGDDRAVDSIPESYTTTPNIAANETDSDMPPSFRIKSESDGEREMTEEEVSKLVHDALRRARRATLKKDGNSDAQSPLSAISTPTSVRSGVTRSPPSEYRMPQTLLPSDSDPSQAEMDALLSPTMDSLIGSISNSHSMMSANSSDSVLRKVEEEIQSARRAAMETTRRIGTYSAASQSFGEPYEIALSPTSELMGILDDHLADDEDLRTILDTNDDEVNKNVDVDMMDDNVFETAQEELEAEFADTPTKAPSTLEPKDLPSQDEGPRLRLGYNPEPFPDSLNTQHGVQEEEVIDARVGGSELSVNYPPSSTPKDQPDAFQEEKVVSQSNLDFEEKKVEDRDYDKTLSPRHARVESSSLVDDVGPAEVMSQEGVTTEFLTGSDGAEYVAEEGFETEDVLIQWPPSDKSSAGSESEAILDSSDENHVQPDSGFDFESETPKIRSEGISIKAVSLIEQEENAHETGSIANLLEDLLGDVKSDASLSRDSSSCKQSDSEFTEVTVSDVPRIGCDVLVSTNADCDENAVEVESSAESDYTEESVSDEEEGEGIPVEAVPREEDAKFLEAPHDEKAGLIERAVEAETFSSEKPVPRMERGTEEHDEADHDHLVDESDGAESEYTEETVSEEEETEPFADDYVLPEKEMKHLAISTNDSEALAPESEVKQDEAKDLTPKSSTLVGQPSVAFVVPKISETYRSPITSAKSPDHVSPRDGTPEKTLLLAPTTDKICFRHPYPFPPPLPKPRPAAIVIQENRLGIPEPFTNWSRTTPEIEKLLLAARDDSLQRRSNACGALKVLSQKRKNQLALVRMKGFLDSLVFAIAAPIPNNIETDTALDARGRAVSTLCNVAEPKANRQVILAHTGIADCLVLVINDDLGEARVQACATIATLAKTQGNREHLATVPGLLDTLAMVLLGSIDDEGSEGCDTALEQNESIDDSVGSHTDAHGESTSACLSNSSSTLEDDGTHGDITHEDEITDDDASTHHGDEHTSVGISSSTSSSRPPKTDRPKQKSIRDEKHDLHDQFYKQARVNACAAIMHLSKHCAVSVSFPTLQIQKACFKSVAYLNLPF